jgi:MHS family shikimate/dehydroshikimate transporter-like MFS transporter
VIENSNTTDRYWGQSKERKMAKAAGSRDMSARKVAGISIVGATIEWYDFFAYTFGAALVFNILFFPSFEPLVGTLLAFSTFAVGFLARPLGAIIWGHVGDKYGRKPALVTALLTMGGATTLVGVLPTYASIGVLAPVALVVLRLAQGLAVGGQWGGIVVMATESAPPGRRGLYGSFAQMGALLGALLANIIFLMLAALLPEGSFVSWGWRLPFIISLALVAVALYAQSRLEETAAMQQLRTARGASSRPILETIRSHPKELVLGTGCTIAAAGTFYILVAYSLAYGTDVLQLPRGIFLGGVLAALGVGIPAILLFAVLSDRIGRRKVALGGCLFMAVWAFPLFWLINTEVPALIWTALVVGSLSFSMVYGPLAALLSEMFSTRVRYSGASLGYQLGTVLGAAFAPIIATSLYAAFGTSAAVSAYLFVIAVISFASVLAGRERYSEQGDSVADAEGATLTASS